MAHLGERHEQAKRRRDELLRDRALSLAMRTGYPEDCTTKTRPAISTKKTVLPIGAAEVISIETRKYTDEELAAAQLRCQDRLKSVREKDAMERRRARDSDDERLVRNQQLSTEAPALAAQRLRERKEKEHRAQEEEVALLISQQMSSIEAMNIARMLSPRFQERVTFVPHISKNSVEEERIQHLLTSPRVGSFYQ